MPSESLFERNPEIARLFPDLHAPFSKQAAVVEANRCLNCFNAPCTIACPTHIDVPKFIKKISSGNLRGSALSIRDANVLASSCARVCPVALLCEGSCVMHQHQQPPIGIGRLQRFAMDAFDASGGKLPVKNTHLQAGRVACIGAGPASLAAAAELRQRGFAVTIFDKRLLPGGLNTYGVAEYKLSTCDSLREIDRIAELGVKFEFGLEISDEAQLAQLEDGFDVIFLGVGLGAVRALNLPGGEHNSVVDALKFIESYKMGSMTRLEGRVVVVGAGNTAIDAAIAATRLGASEVRILYRQSREHISAFDFEYEHARQEGVRFEWFTQPVAVLSVGGHIKGVECARMYLDERGCISPIEGSTTRFECELIIAAIGQTPIVEFLSKFRGVVVEQGRVSIDRTTGQTANPKYFAGGDCVNGGREVVDAVADGKRSAVAIASLLGSVRIG